MKYNKKGITLVSLIITVIILLLLLGLTTVIIPNGLFKKSKNANENAKKDISDTQSEIENIMGEIPKIQDGEEVNWTPKIEKVEISNITTKTATITVTASDRDGDSLTYTLEINGKKESNETGIFEVEDLTANTEYEYTVTVSDGQEKTSTTRKFTTGNSAPVIATNTANSKTTSSITIRMQATDSDGDSLTYTLYYSTSESGTYTNAGTVTGSSGSYVTKTVPGLSEYTLYYWYITVTDGKDTVTSGKNSVRTYCSGTGEICELATYCTDASETICTKCNGKRHPACTGTFRRWDSSSVSSPSTCAKCDESLSVYSDGTYASYVVVFSCGHKETGLCYDCANTYKDTTCTGLSTANCTGCNGMGIVSDTSAGCPTHSGCSVGHYWCSTHSLNCGTSSSHTYCEHGLLEMHD